MDSNISSFLKKIHDTPGLQQLLTDNEKSYQTKLQVAKYSKAAVELFKKNPPILYAGRDKLGRNVFYLTAMIIPESSNKVEYDQWLLYFVTVMEDKLGDKQYIIIFFNTNLMTGSHLKDFKDLMGQMPLKYFSQLDAFIIMHANFIVRSGNFFGSSDLLAYLKKKIEFLDSLNQMSKQTWFNYTLIETLPNEVKKYDSSFKDILKRQQRTQTKIDKGVTSNVQADDDDDDEEFDKESKILGRQLEFYEKNSHKFPILLDILVQYFTQNQQYMLHEGIFRKQAAVYEERILEAAIANKKLRFIQRIEDPHIISGVFKQFFIQLPTPIVTFDTYQLILDKSKGVIPKESADQIKLCQMIVESIPQQNKIILGVCLGFFKQVVFFESSNKMSAYNMSVVFAPCFFRAPQLSMIDIKYAQFFVNLMQILLSEFHHFYPEFDYKQYLTSIVDNKRQSLVPFIPDDTANMQDLQDMMQSEFHFAPQEQDDDDYPPQTQQNTLDKATLDLLMKQDSAPKKPKQDISQSNSLSSLPSGIQSDNEEECF